MDRIDPDDFVVSKEPKPNVLSLYEQRIFDLKSEVMFLRKLTSSNNTLLMEEIKFLRDELHSKNDVIGHLASQVGVGGAEIQYEMGFSQQQNIGELQMGGQMSTLAPHPMVPLIPSSADVADGTEDEILKQTMIDWMGEGWLNEISTGMTTTTKDVNVLPNSRAGGNIGLDIFDQVKTGITPRYRGMEAHVGEAATVSPESCAANQGLNMAQMFGNLFGLSVDTPLKKLRESGMVIAQQHINNNNNNGSSGGGGRSEQPTTWGRAPSESKKRKLGFKKVPGAKGGQTKLTFV